jgi:hypothetical protein
MSEKAIFATERQSSLVFEGSMSVSRSGSVVPEAANVHTPKPLEKGVAKRQDLTLAQVPRNGALSRVSTVRPCRSESAVSVRPKSTPANDRIGDLRRAQTTSVPLMRSDAASAKP